MAKTVADVLVGVLEQVGVKHIFGLIGDSLNPLADAVRRSREVAPVTDPQLVNARGLSRASGSPWWVSDQATGVSTLYNGAGVSRRWSLPSHQPIQTHQPVRQPAPSPTAVKQISRWLQTHQPCSSSPRSMGRLPDGTQP